MILATMLILAAKDFWASTIGVALGWGVIMAVTVACIYLKELFTGKKTPSKDDEVNATKIEPEVKTEEPARTVGGANIDFNKINNRSK